MTAYILTHLPYNPKFWEISCYELSDTRVRNPIWLFSSFETNCAWAGIRTSNLLEEPYRAQSDASAFLTMDPSSMWFFVASPWFNLRHCGFPLKGMIICNKSMIFYDSFSSIYCTNTSSFLKYCLLWFSVLLVDAWPRWPTMIFP